MLWAKSNNNQLGPCARGGKALLYIPFLEVSRPSTNVRYVTLGLSDEWHMLLECHALADLRAALQRLLSLGDMGCESWLGLCGPMVSRQRERKFSSPFISVQKFPSVRPASRADGPQWNVCVTCNVSGQVGFWLPGRVRQPAPIPRRLSYWLLPARGRQQAACAYL